jgi:hypothetical protein
MREVLTDEIVRAECSIFQPFPQSQLLNDVSTQQAMRFKRGSKMSDYLRTVSGSRPESIVAQAISMSGVRNTQVAEDLAMRLKYVQERGTDPVNMEEILAQLTASAQQAQAQAQMNIQTQVNQGVPLDQATQTVEQNLVRTTDEDAISAEELSEMEDHAEMVNSEKANAVNSAMDLMSAFGSYNRQQLLAYYARVKRPGALPASHYRVSGITKGEIMEAILEQKPDITAEDLTNHRDLMRNAMLLKDGLKHEHNHPQRSRPERLRGSSSSSSSTMVTAESGSESSSSGASYKTAPMSMDAAMLIERYRASNKRTAAGDRAVEQFERTGTFVEERAERQEARTIAGRFEERHHIPEWLNAFSHAAQDVLQQNTPTEGLARRAENMPRPDDEL